MGIHSVGMGVSGGFVPIGGLVGCAMGAGSLNQFYTLAQIDDFRAILDSGEQRCLEIDQTDVEDHSGPVEFHDLFGSGLEGFGTCACRDENIDVKILTDNIFDDVFQGKNRDIQGLFIGCRLCGAGGADEDDDPEYGCFFHRHVRRKRRIIRSGCTFRISRKGNK